MSVNRILEPAALSFLTSTFFFFFYGFCCLNSWEASKLKARVAREKEAKRKKKKGHLYFIIFKVQNKHEKKQLDLDWKNINYSVLLSCFSSLIVAFCRFEIENLVLFVLWIKHKQCTIIIATQKGDQFLLFLLILTN